MKKLHTNKLLYSISIIFITFGCIGLIAAFTMKQDRQTQGSLEVEEISFALYGDAEVQKITEEAAETFMNQEHCKVDIYCYATEEELNSKIIGQIAGGTAFDAFYASQDVIDILADKKELQSLDDVLKERRGKGDEFYTVALENGKLDGVQYALPAGVMPYMIYYNKSFLEENGLEDLQVYFENKKWDLSGFVSYARAVKQKTGKPGITLTSDWSLVEPFLRCNGGGYSISGEKAELDAQALATLELITQLIQEGAVENCSTEEYENLKERFSKGEIPMIAGGLEMTRLCSNVDFAWDIIPYPSMESNFENSNFEVPLIAAGNGKHKELARKFISYYISALGQKIRLEKGECLIPSLNMVFYTSMGDVKFPEHSNYYFFTIENGYSSSQSKLSEEGKTQILTIWNEYMGEGT